MSNILRNSLRLSPGGNVGERSFDDSLQNTRVASYYEKVRDCNDHRYILAAIKMRNKR